MTMRYCGGCRAEVEDTGGFCLLGHALSLKPPTSSLSELRAEVDRVFDEAKVEVVTAMSPPPPPPRRTEPARSGAPDAPPAPSPSRRVFEELEVEQGSSHDPISAFAPPPRMDWGPEERRLRWRARSAG